LYRWDIKGYAVLENEFGCRLQQLDAIGDVVWVENPALTGVVSV
jgi:hypothetical protein